MMHPGSCPKEERAQSEAREMHISEEKVSSPENVIPERCHKKSTQTMPASNGIGKPSTSQEKDSNLCDAGGLNLYQTVRVNGVSVTTSDDENFEPEMLNPNEVILHSSSFAPGGSMSDKAYCSEPNLTSSHFEIPSALGGSSSCPNPTSDMPSRKSTGKRSSSDGAAEALQARRDSLDIPKERGRSCSHSDGRVLALKARINEKFDQLEKEYGPRKWPPSSSVARQSMEDSAILAIQDGETLASPDLSTDFSIASEDTCVFTSTGPASMGCELRSSSETRRSRSMSIAEVKEQAYAKLQSELKKAQEELKLKDEEMERLNKIRGEIEAELEDLTSSLFEEANNMVRDANIKRAMAEKQLREANLKTDGLQAEVQALKTLVITSTPSMPNPHLHPQINSRPNGVRSFLRGPHKRSPSNYELGNQQDSPPSSPVREVQPVAANPESSEVDPVYHKEFVSWRQSPVLDRNHVFLSRIYDEDIIPCLRFANKELTAAVLHAIEANSIIIESVSGKSPFPKENKSVRLNIQNGDHNPEAALRCALLDAPRLCKYRMKLGESEEWHYISHLCRNRIIAVCDFFCYLRYIQQGLVKSGIHDVYWEVMRKRQAMSSARLGLAPE